MAQDFRNVLVRTIGTSDTTLLAGGNYDAVIGIRCCNILTSTIAIDVKIAKGGADYFLAKGVSIPPNSAIELIPIPVNLSPQLISSPAITNDKKQLERIRIKNG